MTRWTSTRYEDVVRLAGSVSDDDGLKPSEGKVDEWSLIQMAGRMEIISIHDISLAKFLGSGGYGEVCCPLGVYPGRETVLLSHRHL